MYINQPVEQYLNDLASENPTPGGGSASALSGALAAGLASMVARLTLGRAEYADVKQEIETILQHTEQLRLRFQQLMQEDIDAYGRLSACFKMPRTTEDEISARNQAIQAALVEAALVPLEVVEGSAELVQYCQRIAEVGNVKVLSDIATSAMLAASAGAGASWMVRVNLRSLKNLEQVNLLSERLTQALDSVATISQQITSIVGART